MGGVHCGTQAEHVRGRLTDSDQRLDQLAGSQSSDHGPSSATEWPTSQQPRTKAGKEQVEGPHA